MAYIISSTDLKIFMYEEVINDITNSDTEIINHAIAAAIQCAAGYLNDYDIPQVLGTPEVDATITDAFLKSNLIDIAKYHLVKLANPNSSYAEAHECYLMAIEKYFEMIQKGKIVPYGWPKRNYKTDPAPNVPGIKISVTSNEKQNFRF